MKKRNDPAADLTPETEMPETYELSSDDNYDDGAKQKSSRKPFTTKVEDTRAFVVVPILPERYALVVDQDESERPKYRRSDEARLEEAAGLARAIDLKIIDSFLVQTSQPRPATLLGTGKVEDIAERIEREEIELVIVDHPLTPVQQRNLEREWKVKVIDRTGLILEIFGRRAQTREGSLQVELAHLNYQKGRLVRSWTHLERQRGGGGFMGGPGETQIEADRRMLQEKILRIKRELDTVVRTRQLHRQKRRKVPHPVIALVGYTNAGKSTLFNRLTGADVLAEDMLFATLDPTLRRLRLPHGDMIILSDTVGFISNLPHHLVAAFKATLEEVIEADLILHVRDMSDPDNAAQAEDVETILSGLGIKKGDERVIEIWNKIDRLSEPMQDSAENLSSGSHEDARPLPLSALTGQGTSELLALIESRISGAMEKVQVSLQPDQFGLIDWIYRHGSNVRRQDEEDGSVIIDVDMTAGSAQKFRDKYASVTKRS
ncbi:MULTISPECIES: GTPase HflX [unclassified Pseudochrobactrum]|uniref:GTPase HflX n=2 Tax=unclassified Pseudochrobactrum TaxID=2647013 RepID=UPI000A8F047D|nr:MULTISPECIES: GTPase HflX [unclassified Pseudochrobactrum]UCA46801.1 GTPase HflX [Pseudochrobactrum sp. XF203]